MKGSKKIEDSNSNIHFEQDFVSRLKAEIEQAKEELRNGNFITHEEMLLELKRKKLI